jgi:hypothetical protein
MSISDLLAQAITPRSGKSSGLGRLADFNPLRPFIDPQIPDSVNIDTGLPTPQPNEMPRDYVARSFLPENIHQVTQSAPANFALGLSGPISKIGGILAYHGSPHDFNQFDLSKIGTGEGFQTFGHGLYFAENPAVSGQGGRYWNQFLRKFEGSPELEAAQILQANRFDRASAINQAEGLVRHYNDKYSQDMLNLLQSDKPVGPRTYEVNINADPAQFLDWDKTLAAQSTDPGRLLSAGRMADIEPRLKTNESGEQFYRRLAGSGDPSAYADAAAILDESGIPGIKYLDQGSRRLGVPRPNLARYEKKAADLEDLLKREPSEANQNRLSDAMQELESMKRADDQTSNYVVFDPKIVEILRKYGILAPLAGGAAALSDDDTAPSPLASQFKARRPGT